MKFDWLAALKALGAFFCAAIILLWAASFALIPEIWGWRAGVAYFASHLLIWLFCSLYSCIARDHRDVRERVAASASQRLKENADLHAQAERLVSTIEIHHRNFDELHERASREPGDFAAWVAGMTHPDAAQR